MDILDIQTKLCFLIADALSLECVPPARADTPLFGAIAELDSHGVILLIAAIEEHFSVSLPDEELSANTFATLGNLVDLISRAQR